MAALDGATFVHKIKREIKSTILNNTKNGLMLATTPFGFENFKSD